MSKTLQSKLSSLENLICIQTDCVGGSGDSLAYMHGMLNGLICAHSVFSGSAPQYMSTPSNRNGSANVRHKAKRVKGRLR